MSVPGVQVLVFRTLLNFRRPFIFSLHKVRNNSSVAAVAVEPVKVLKNRSHNASDEKGDDNAPKWKKLSSEELGISTSMIAKPTRLVLNGLKEKGFEVYLVGGCVRDLILDRTPKDFDILTSAELKEVPKIFRRCKIIGRRFPICHVHINDTIVEVFLKFRALLPLAGSFRGMPIMLFEDLLHAVKLISFAGKIA